MLQLTSDQYNAIHSGHYKVVWLFDVVDNSSATHRWSMINYYTPARGQYTGRIVKNSFEGITERRRCHEDGRWTATECSFAVETISSDIDPADFVQDGRVIVRLVVNDNEIRNWHFKIVSVGKAYKLATFSCVDLLTSFLLLNDYPETRLVKDIFLEKNPINDNMCVAVPFGTVFFPMRPVWCQPTGKSEGRYYLLGPSAFNYNVISIRTPREHPNRSTWTTGLTVYTSGNYKVLEAKIADTDGDGVPDAQGLWWTTKLLDVPVKFSRSDTTQITNPGDVLSWILQDFGIPSSFIDVAAKTVYNAWGLAWAGILSFKQARDTLIARLLVQCGSVLDPREQITLRILRKESVATLTSDNVVSKSFSYTPAVAVDHSDSGYIAWQDADEPWDQFQKLIIPIKESSEHPSSISYTMDFVHNQLHALSLGQLALQRTLGVIGYARCAATPDCLALQPYDVITINDDLYWPGLYEVDVVHVQPTGYVELSLRHYNHTLDNFEDLDPSPRSPYEVPPEEIIWKPVLAGPDDPGSGGTLQNSLSGRITVGSDRDNRIIIDPVHPGVTGPVLELIENDVPRFRLGKVGSNNYGLITYSNEGAEVIRIDSNVAKICGWQMTATKLSSPGIEIDSGANQIKVYNSSNYVALSPAGLEGYDSVLGRTIKIPTDGSAPEFSSGVIKECVYEIYTSGVIRTSESPATAGGVLINSEGIRGYNSSGAMKFKLDASTGTLWAEDAQIRGSITLGTGSVVPWDYVSGTGKPENNATNDQAWRYYDGGTTYINGGMLYVGSSITVGSSVKGGKLVINASKTDYGDGILGAFLGFSNGFKFEVYGSSTNYIRWDGTNLIVKGSIIVESDSSSQIHGDKIVTGTITANAIAASAITGDKIASRTITADKIVTGTITANEIASRTITADRIIAGTITANEIAYRTISADKIKAGEITAYEIAASTITSAEIASSTITATNIRGTNFGTLTISSGAIVLGTSGAIRVDSGDGLFISSNGTIRFVSYSTGPHIWAGSTNMSFYAPSTMYISALGTINMFTGGIRRICFYTNEYIDFGANLWPTSTNSYGVGTSARYWNTVYATNVYFRYAYTFDTENDLDMIEAIPILRDNNGDPVLDENGLFQFDIPSMDPRLTNMRSLAHELSAEFERKITMDDLLALRSGGAIETEKGTITWNDIKDRVFINTQAMLGLSLGAAKQLRQKIRDDRAFYQSAIENLQNKLTGLERRIK